MLSCLIVDDEPNAVKLLSAYVGRVPYLHLAHACYDADEALPWIQERRVELVFLDINMPGMNGLELASLVSGEQRFIFTTAYSEYAVRSYETPAVDYLMKPIAFPRFLQAVGKVVGAAPRPAPEAPANASPSDYFFVKSGRQIVRVRYDAIRYVEGLKSYVQLVTATEKVIIYKRMQEMEALLPAQFRRVHHSYIVNLQQIQRIEENHVLLPPTSIPISAKYRDAFLEAIKTQLI
jgi:DNA-binding LytR/AlgR family response regulator